MIKDKSTIAAIVRDEITNAQGFYSDELSANRESALNYYYTRPKKGDEDLILDGRSTIQTSDVADMIEALLSSVGPILTNETLIQFEADGENDEAQAELESDFVAYTVGGQNQGSVELKSAIKDALLLRNGWIKVAVEREEYDEPYTLENVNEFEIEAELDKQGNSSGVELVSVEPGEDRGKYNAKFILHVHKRELIVKSVDPANMLYSGDHDSADLNKCRMIAERAILTRSELIELGYSADIVARLSSIRTDNNTERRARNKSQSQTDQTPLDDSQEEIETYYAYILIDVKGKGRAERRMIHIAPGADGDEILEDLPVDWVPYATGSPFIEPHRVTGLSIYDKLAAIQDSSTHFLRAWHDVAASANQHTIVFNPKETEETDVTSGRPAKGIRSKNPGNVNLLAGTDYGQSFKAALDYNDQKRSERAGASLDLGAAEFQLAGQVGDQGAERQISIKEQLASMIADNLAKSMIREVYLLVHKTLREYVPGALTAKLNGKWLETDPSTWPERRKLNVMVGMSRGEKSQRMMALSQVISLQIQLYQAGKDGEVVDDGGVFNAVSDWCRAAGLENSAQYWIDPGSPEAKQAAKQKAEQQSQAQQQQQQMIEEQQRMQNQLFALTQQLEKYRHDSELVYKYAKDRLDAEIEEAKIVGQATLDLEREQNKFEQLGAAQADAAAPGVTQ